MARQSQEERRAQLIALGRRLFSTHAYDSISTEAIAKEAGISKGLLYHYFSDKRAYYVATVESLAEELLALLPFRPTEDISQTVQVTLDGFLDFIEANAAMYQALLRGGIGMDAQVHGIVENVRRTLLTRIQHLLSIHDSPLNHLRLYGWLGFVEHSSLEWLEHRAVSRESLKKLWIETLLFPTTE